MRRELYGRAIVQVGRLALLGRRVLCSGAVALLFTVVGCGAPDEPTAQSSAPSTPETSVTSVTAPASATSAAESGPATATTAPSQATTPTRAGAPSAPAGVPAPTRGGAPQSQVTPTVTRVAGDPTRDAYLAAITEAGVQVSPTGDAEVLVAQGICRELAKGTPRATVVGYVSGIDDTMTPELAEAVVAASQRVYC